MKPREQGDAGELSALSWFVEHGWSVFLPFGHSPDVDLVARWDGEMLGVQVNTCGFSYNGRWTVAICTRGGNQSWNKIVKRFGADRCDSLFVLCADGRRWLIPAEVVGGGTSIGLGGPKYAPYEIEPGLPFTPAAATRRGLLATLADASAG